MALEDRLQRAGQEPEGGRMWLCRKLPVRSMDSEYGSSELDGGNENKLGMQEQEGAEDQGQLLTYLGL